MQPPMLHTAHKVTTTRNAYGDYIFGAETALVCHFRYITEQVFADNQTIQSDAMAWFEADSGIDRKSIIKFNGEHFIVERVTRARRLRNTDIQFIKVEMRKYGVVS